MEMTCIIVDDEYLLRESLADFIQKFCPGLKLAGKAANAGEAREMLQKENVDVIFCDIQMPEENGFQFLESIDVSKYHIVFVTAYNEYALRAIKARAFDYLLKPVDTEELKKTVDALQHSVAEKKKGARPPGEYKNEMQQLLDEIKGNREPAGKIAIHHATGILFIEIDDILFLEGDGGYTVVHLTNGKKIIATRILSGFEDLLPESLFFRIHKSTIVNLKYVTEFSRSEGFSLVLKNGVQLAVGRRRVQAVLDRFQSMAKNI